jgi:antitoxin component YwqK of YwqJK toxin-antitoxin module
MNGKWTFWYANGVRKSEGEYVRNHREGKWAEWNEAGEKISEQIFHAGSK